jgi:hypothetical protein
VNFSILDATVNNPYFWLVVSFFSSALLTWLLLSRPRKWWVLFAALAVVYVLFSLGGVLGFLAALWVKLKRAIPVKREPKKKKRGRKG